MKKTFVFVMIALLCGRFTLAQDAAGQTSAPDAVSTTQDVQPKVEDVFVPTTAVLPFEARGRQAESSKAGWNISELLFINLLESGSIDMVERPELEKALDELHLSAVGMTSPDTQMKLGQLVGAKILITGSLFETGKKKYVVAKIIGTETSRVVGCSVSGTNEYEDLIPELTSKILAVLNRNVSRLLPAKNTVFSAADRLAGLNGNERKIYLQINENTRHATSGSLSEPILHKLLQALNFQLTDVRADADFIIVCNAVATDAGQYQKFHSATANVTLSLYQGRTDKLLAVDTRKETMAGPEYLSAAQVAIEQATLKLATDVLKKLK